MLLTLFIWKIPPGLSNGDPVVFPRTRRSPNVVEEEPHPMFKRVGGFDLWIKKEITLVEALTEETFTLELLDKRILTLEKPRQPFALIKIANEGMPIADNEDIGVKGSLFVHFDVVFPEKLCLNEEQKEELKRLLSEEEEQ